MDDFYDHIPLIVAMPTGVLYTMGDWFSDHIPLLVAGAAFILKPGSFSKSILVGATMVYSYNWAVRWGFVPTRFVL